MFLPAQYLWFEPVLIAAIVVFVVSLISNIITFSNRFVSALFTGILFAVIFGVLAYTGYGSVSMSASTEVMTKPAAN